jgi:hypothetical protein
MSFSFVVRKTGFNEWTIFSEQGVEQHRMIYCPNAHIAETMANAWASSWESANVKVVEDVNIDGEDKTGSGVPEPTSGT